MASFSRYYRPQLRAGVDIQLSNAYNDGNWPVVMRLADKRAKSFNDPYYEALKVCAESQLESPTEKCAALVAVDGLVRNGTTAPSLDALELYEWACSGLQNDFDYGDTLGVLRWRWIKANPKNAEGSVACLRACLQRWDLVNAQQIAASMDKNLSSSGDRRYMFWNIGLTYLLSISPQCPPSKQKIYSLLALKQLERAADVTESSEKEDLSDRGIRMEEEYNFFFQVMSLCGQRDEYLKRIQSPRLGAMHHFAQGRKDLFVDALPLCEGWGEWAVIFQFCEQALNKDDEDGSPSLLGSSLSVWKTFITAAGKQSDDEQALRTVGDLLSRLIDIKSKLAHMYTKVLSIALLELTFRTPVSLLPQHVGDADYTPRLAQLGIFIDQNFNKSSLFDEIRPFLEELSFGEANYLVEKLTAKMANTEDRTKRVCLDVLRLKIRYLLTTCPQTTSHLPSVIGGKAQAFRYQCRVCSSPCRRPCTSCLESIIQEAVVKYKTTASQENSDTFKSFDKDPRLDLTLVIVSCLLKLSALGDIRSPRSPRLQHINTARLLQAVVALDWQLQQLSGDIPLRLLLIHLYLLIGCASTAYHLWTPMDVKRTILDSMAPLFFDRLSSVAPSLFHGTKPVAEPLRSYYSSVLAERCPLRLWDAFAAGSYSSVLDIATYDNRLRRSCTMVMSVVEDRRAARAFGGKLDAITDEVLPLYEITDHTTLVDPSDYGSFPTLESSKVPQFQNLVQIGPAPTSERSHLALLAEQFIDIVTHKPPKEYKPVKAGEIAAKERSYAIEALLRLQNSLMTFLHGETTASKLTRPEHEYYTIVSLLACLLATALSAPRGETLPTIASQAAATLKASLESLQSSVLVPLPSDERATSAANGAPETTNSDPLFLALSDPHSLSTLRDAALAVRYSAGFGLSWHDRESARDRTGKSSLHKDAVAELRALEGLAGSVLAAVRTRVKAVKDRLAEGGWLDRVAEWTFGLEGASGGQEDSVTTSVGELLGDEKDGVVEEWAGKMLESWRDGWKGLGQAKME